MKFLWILFLSGPALAGVSAQLELSGRVYPALEIGIQPFNDGFSISNRGNALALFQIGSRDKAGRQIAWLRADQQLFLHTDYVQKTGEILEIRILAP